MKRTIACLAIALQVPLASAAFRCVDERGLTLVGDTPPPGCANVPMYEITATGKVLRRIEPTPSPEQVKTLREAQERRAAEQKAAAEQKRKDMALLASYGSAQEFDVARDRNIEPVKGRIDASEKRLKELDGQEKSLEERLEFYKAGKAVKADKAGTAPRDPGGAVEDANLTWFNGELERVRAERATTAQSIARQKKEIEEIGARFATDKQRWISIKAGSRSPAGTATEPASAPAKSGKPGY
jgi:type II secretory pathway component PulJ